jgi:hypothetical protein
MEWYHCKYREEGINGIVQNYCAHCFLLLCVKKKVETILGILKKIKTFLHQPVCGSYSLEFHATIRTTPYASCRCKQPLKRHYNREPEFVDSLTTYGYRSWWIDMFIGVQSLHSYLWLKKTCKLGFFHPNLRSRVRFVGSDGNSGS